ncbi:hypothetical protein DAI22_04g284200 [Oryza sativa Japonica Group]|nr:hypothetical protein DAI22_04g284200 [Oryza sativa Japonica Group]
MERRPGALRGLSSSSSSRRRRRRRRTPRRRLRSLESEARGWGWGGEGEDIGCAACEGAHLKPTDFRAIPASRSPASPPIASAARGPTFRVADRWGPNQHATYHAFRCPARLNQRLSLLHPKLHCSSGYHSTVTRERSTATSAAVGYVTRGLTSLSLSLCLSPAAAGEEGRPDGSRLSQGRSCSIHRPIRGA